MHLQAGAPEADVPSEVAMRSCGPHKAVAVFKNGQAWRCTRCRISGNWTRGWEWLGSWRCPACKAEPAIERVLCPACAPWKAEPKGEV